MLLGLECSNCVLQWHYTAGNNWGVCANGTGALGCGPQEQFRGCADISIEPQPTVQTVSESTLPPATQSTLSSVTRPTKPTNTITGQPSNNYAQKCDFSYLDKIVKRLEILINELSLNNNIIV